MNQTKTNSKKKYAPLMLAGLMGVGALGVASAFLTNKESATEANLIKPGTFNIVFDNEQNAINLSGNDAVPSKFHSDTGYTFDILNSGDIDADYNLKVVANHENTIDPSLVDIYMVAGIDRYSTTLDQGTLTNKSRYAPAKLKNNHTIMVKINEKAKLADYEGKVASFHVEAEATQKTENLSYDQKNSMMIAQYEKREIANCPEIVKTIANNFSVTKPIDYVNLYASGREVYAGVRTEGKTLEEISTYLKSIGFTNITQEDGSRFKATDSSGNEVSANSSGIIEVGVHLI